MASGTSLNELSHTTTETARSRCRKPRATYKSPSEGDPCLIESSTLHIGGSTTPCSGHGSVSFQASSGISSKRQKGRRPRFFLLPLYHPLGRLALSLPPLDLANVGLPILAGSDSFARPHRSLGKLRDEGDPLLFTGSTFEGDTREKVNTHCRKRRNGGAPRRKRRDADDGDATYPRKRNRVVKGNRSRAGDEESSTESVVQVGETFEAEDKQSERRSTRSKGTLKRRGSSTSDDAPTEDAKGDGEAVSMTSVT